MGLLSWLRARKAPPLQPGELHTLAGEGALQALADRLKPFPDAVNSRAGADETPLHWAAQNGKYNVALFLLGKHADVNAKAREGETPLHLAVLNKQLRLVKLLLENFAEVDALAKGGITPLQLAATEGDGDIAQLLLHAGASSTRTDDQGKTAIDRARDGGHETLAVILGQHAQGAG